MHEFLGREAQNEADFTQNCFLCAYPQYHYFVPWSDGQAVLFYRIFYTSEYKNVLYLSKVNVE